MKSSLSTSIGRADVSASDQFMAEIARIIRGARAPRAGQIKTRVFHQLKDGEVAPCPECGQLPWVESGITEYYVYCDHTLCRQGVYGRGHSIELAIHDWDDQTFRGEYGLVQ